MTYDVGVELEIAVMDSNLRNFKSSRLAVLLPKFQKTFEKLQNFTFIFYPLYFSSIASCTNAGEIERDYTRNFLKNLVNKSFWKWPKNEIFVIFVSVHLKTSLTSFDSVLRQAVNKSVLITSERWNFQLIFFSPSSKKWKTNLISLLNFWKHRKNIVFV